LAKLQSVPVSTLTAAPTGGIISTPQSVNNPALTADGKPELLYIGAEFCPHCAAERWPMYIALSKFGTFSPQPGQIHSANEDGDVPTLTFYGTKYTSPYFTFTPVEAYTNKPAGNGYAPLQSPTQAQLTLWQNTNGGSFPFVDIGGKEVLPGAQYSFEPLQSEPFGAVADQVGNNSTEIGANIDASAAQLISTICGSLTHGQPSDVCSAAHSG
jgi:thiol-disulfide isomerase/thioredoxin